VLNWTDLLNQTVLAKPEQI